LRHRCWLIEMPCVNRLKVTYFHKNGKLLEGVRQGIPVIHASRFYSVTISFHQSTVVTCPLLV
jgi:hypothetical protein